MSLIIDMLKELDNRQNNARPIAPGLITADYASGPSRFFTRRNMMAAISMLAISIISYGIIHKRMAHHIAPIPAETSAPKTPISEKVTTDATALKPVAINGVTYETDESNTKVIFQLTHDALYRLVSNEEKHQLTLYIDNATMQSDLPTLIGSTVGIQSMSSAQLDDSLKFTLYLKPGVTLKSADLNKDTANPELILTIANPQEAPIEPVSNTIQTTSNIKSPALQTIVTDQYEKAVQLSETGNTIEAIALFRKLLKHYPDYNDARVALAALVLSAGNPAEAKQLIDDGLAKTPDYIPLIELKARLLTAEGKTSEALAVLQSENPSLAEAPNYHALIAALYNRQNNYELASTIYQRLVAINPHEGSWWFGYGLALDKLGRSQDAVFAYTKAATEGRLNTQATLFLQKRLHILREANYAQS